MTSKKDFENKLQEVRNKNVNKISYLKRKQLEEEFDEYLKEELNRINDEDSTSER